MEPFRVFCGWDKRQADAAEVFKFSVEQNASIEVDVRFLKIDKLPIERRGVTDFTYSRFLVPFLCGYEGRALFADGCDQLCLGDVRELAELDMQDKPVWVVKHPPIRKVPLQPRARSWTSLMLMDCAKLPWWTPKYVEAAQDAALMQLYHLTVEAIGELPGEWNYLMPVDGDPQWKGSVWGSSVTLGLDEHIVPVVRIAHWSYLSDPNGNSWIDRSGSGLWAEWRERWLEGRDGRAQNKGGRPRKVA